MNAAPAEPPADSDDRLADSAGTRTTYLTALAVFLGSSSFNFWWPFMPLYMLDLGATSDANALFWVATATSAQGICRLATSPIWGVLADKLGRKIMFLRTLYLAALTGTAAALIAHPWQLTFALALQGIFSGFIAPAVALVSVSVPDVKLNKSISIVTGAQYLGSTVGPAVGGVLAVILGFRGTILIGAMLPLVAGAIIHAFVPRDRIETARVEASGKPAGLEPFRPTMQFAIAIFLFMMLFATNQLARLITPIALRAIEHADDVKAISSVAFTMAGAFSAFGVLVIAMRVFVPGRLRQAISVSCLIAGGGMLLMALSLSLNAAVYIAGFILITIMISAMIPATNTLIAMNVTRSRRGTAFGIASSAQAVAFIVGPFSATLIAAVSIDMGFVILAGIMVALGAGLFLAIREPAVANEADVAAGAAG